MKDPTYAIFFKSWGFKYDTGDGGHEGDKGDRGDTGERGDTGLSRSTILRHEIEPKMGEISNSKKV